MAELTPEQIKNFQAKLKTAIETGDKAIYSAAKELPGAWDKLASGIENALTLGTLKETKARVMRTFDDAVATWETRKKILWAMVATGTFDGKPVNDQQVKGAFLMIQTSIKQTQTAIALINEFGKGTILSDAVGKTFGQIAGGLSAAFEAVGAVGGGVLTTVKTIGKLLPWIIGGAIILPFLFRTFSAYKRGGATAAADEAAGQIERGRSAAASAVASGARKIASRGMAGVRRRRRSNRG